MALIVLQIALQTQTNVVIFLKVRHTCFENVPNDKCIKSGYGNLHTQMGKNQPLESSNALSISFAMLLEGIKSS